MRGKFVWHDLMTTDLAASRAFYSKLFPWQLDDVDMGAAGKYTMLKVGDDGVGGMVPLDKSAGVPSHWVAYVNVDDVDATVAESTKLGGKPCVPPTDIPNIGRFALIEDPSGAIVSPFRAKDAGASDGHESDSPKPHGHFVWDELLIDDPDKVVHFYETLFGYKTTIQDMGTLGKYTVFKRRNGEIDAAGMLRSPPNAQHRPFWLPYVKVEEVEAYAEKATVLGAKIYVPPSKIPNLGRFSVLADPTGATLAIFTPS